jgi:hypothetical protein
MEAIGPQRVYSFDHVAINDKVIACDIKKVPLADDALDVAVFSLSLMANNWSEYDIRILFCYLSLSNYRSQMKLSLVIIT